VWYASPSNGQSITCPRPSGENGTIEQLLPLVDSNAPVITAIIESQECSTAASQTPLGAAIGGSLGGLLLVIILVLVIGLACCTQCRPRKTTPKAPEPVVYDEIADMTTNKYNPHSIIQTRSNQAYQYSDDDDMIENSLYSTRDEYVDMASVPTPPRGGIL